ncbi:MULTISPECIES: hypothetical protein [Bradyrhizobium]|uniref:Uncharacterized protein n=1 Tax=Bradyrhizobium ottawaense TaxID=931866 RepID=A0ABV4FXM3_9BRAD|nr:MULTISPECIES: hypothetical protein [Bradyrhizobium]WQN85264.1 hypothetical protein U7859_13115 [Bradyrhizobium ottawaense]
MIRRFRGIVWQVCFIFLMALHARPNLAYAQIGSTSSRLTLQGAAEQSNKPIIRDALGRPCLDVEAAARAHIVNPQVVDHVVSVKNNCSRRINVKVCYFGSDRCNVFDLLGYKRMDTILGTMTGIKVFKYTVFQN